MNFIMVEVYIYFNNWSERSACTSGQHLGGHYFAYFGPSEVRATSGQHLGGHYFGPSVVRAPAASI